jgi:hypothetical protein
VYFGHYVIFRVILVMLEFSGLFWSFWCFRCILIFPGYFLSFWRFRGYFDHFKGF